MGRARLVPFCYHAAMVSEYRIYVCHGATCGKAARPVWNALTDAIHEHGLDHTCQMIVSGCLSRCEYGPNINVYPNLTRYAAVTPEDARRIVAEHLAGGERVEALRYREAWEIEHES
jgi:NADP-reducing hydrogenase subunit HndC